ncbi:MFS transporter [Nigerium massiliense]|uniref:MFS transporter n=1 Tax=Nigerium massiliense TaxID=1522317 RepID=UPI0005916224|nr:MFS transporter [Nigerium massiliense]
MNAPTPSLRLRRARWAVAALFWLNGATIASVVPRYPLVKDNLDIPNAFFGLALAVGPFGALIAGAFTSPLLRRFGSARVATWAQVAQVVFAGLVLNAPNPWLFAAFVFLMSSVDVYTDIAMNSHGLRVQRGYGRSINNAFHAFWSFGAVCGGLVGAFFAGIALPLPWHALGFGALLILINVLLRPHLLPGHDKEPDAQSDAAPPARVPRAMWWPLIALGLIAAFGASIEDAGFSWSALFLRGDLGASPAVAGLGVVSLVGAQTIGRLTGDRLVDRFGNRRVAQVGCTLGAAGMGLALLFPSVPLVLIGYACAGWGVATIVPAVYATADELAGLPHGAGLVVVNWILRLGFVIMPPLVGFVSDATSLRIALIIMPVAMAAIVALSGHLRGRVRGQGSLVEVTP